MAGIFKGTPGTLVAIKSGQDGEATAPALISVDGLPDSTALIVTSLDVQASARRQVTPSIGGPQYFYAFGDNLSQISLRVVVFPSNCDGAGSNSAISQLWDFYDNNRVSPSQIRAVRIAFVDRVIRGLLVSMSLSATAEDRVTFVTGTLQLEGWIEASGSSSGASGSAGSSTNAAASGDGSVSYTATAEDLRDDAQDARNGYNRALQAAASATDTDTRTEALREASQYRADLRTAMQAYNERPASERRLAQISYGPARP